MPVETKNEEEKTMKKITKRMFGLIAVLMLTVSMIPSAAMAATVPGSIVQYMGSLSNGSSAVLSILDLTSKQSVELSSVKVSNSKVLKLDYVYNGFGSGTTKYVNGENSKFSNKYADIVLQIKNAGTSTVSYKLGSKTYKTTVKILKYQNPIKSIEFFGIKNGSSKNLAGLLKNSSTANVKLTKSLSNQKIKVTAATGWKITNISLYCQDTGISYYYSGYDTPKTTVSLNVDSVNKGNSYSVNVSFINTKNGADMMVAYYVN